MHLNWSEQKLTDTRLSNRIKKMPETERVKVLVLDLFTNKLVNPWLHLCLFPNLESLALENNQIVCVPDMIEKMPNLRSLCLMNNYIYTLSTRLKCLKKLEQILLTRNTFLAINLQRNTFFPDDTQRFINELTLYTWRPRALRAAVTWMMVSRRLPYYGGLRDVWKMVGKIVVKSCGDEIWDETDFP